MLLRQREIPDGRDIRYLGTPIRVLASVQDTFDLAMMPFDANGKNLSLIFSAENANVLRVLRYYDLIVQFCQHARAEAGLGCRFAALG